MDDLNGLDWSAKANGQQSNYTSQPLTYTQPPFTASRPSSGLSSSASNLSPVKAAIPAADSFSNLLPSSNKAKTNLSLQERQKQLLQERQRQIEEQQKRHAADARLWDTLGATSRLASAPSTANGTKPDEDEEDMLAGFSASTKVDKSSHFPPPSSTSQSRQSTPAMPQTASMQSGMSLGAFDDDDDPFGLSSIASRRPQPMSSIAVANDDDFLGELGKPVQPKTSPVRSPSPPGRNSPPGIARAKSNSTPLDRSVAELVDMGFPPERARVALEESGGNLQNAVGWLLNQAHAESQQKAQGRSTKPTSNSTASQSPDDSVPSWVHGSRPTSQQRRPDSSASNPDRDASKLASEVGASFLKSANSLWKAGRKQMQKAVADLQQEVGDPSQPKWMRDTSSESSRSATPSQPHRSATNPHQQGPVDMTDEAILLESRDARPPRAPRPATRIPHEPRVPSPLRGRSPAQVLPERPAPSQRLPQQPTPQARAPTKFSREQVEAQASQVYVSAARRRKPAAPKEPEPEVDLFSPAPATASQVPTSSNRPSTASARPSPTPSRTSAPPRDVPSVSPTALSQSAQHRAKGTEAFKRGDFDAAHQAYTAALSSLPPSHPITIVVLSNRALTAIKTGDPKLAIQDADKALAIIGPSRGESESIDLGTEGRKDMKDLFGKSLMRKAEALEAMEKWKDALAVWRLAIEAGVGGATAVRGRDRCTKATQPAPPALASKPTPAPRAPTRKPEPPRPKVAPSTNGEAVKKLRAQNEAAERLDDEKFALADSVTARIEGWRGGKSDNLRALLSSMETVLWEGAAWKKVSIAELVLPNKVKIIYMKAIAKVHPDKISQDATTEQRMISGSVFSTLNEAWDKFKAENGM